MIKAKFAAISVLFAIGLSACSSSDSDDDRRPSYDDLATRGESLISNVVEMDITPLENMPVTGTASYEGVAAFSYDRSEEADVLSELQLEANFANSEVGGRFHNFVDATQGNIDGQLDISNGRIIENHFEAEAAGRLTLDGESSDVELSLEGDFGGDSADAVIGFADGGATNGEFDIEDIFVAERK